MALNITVEFEVWKKASAKDHVCIWISQFSRCLWKAWISDCTNVVSLGPWLCQSFIVSISYFLPVLPGVVVTSKQQCPVCEMSELGRCRVRDGLRDVLFYSSLTGWGVCSFCGRRMGLEDNFVVLCDQSWRNVCFHRREEGWIRHGLFTYLMHSGP